MSGSLTSSLTSTNQLREFHARACAVTVHTTLTALRVTFRQHYCEHWTTIAISTNIITLPLTLTLL
jgi:hypothetical protein